MKNINKNEETLKDVLQILTKFIICEKIELVINDIENTCKDLSFISEIEKE